jgi:hypothetical protein
MLVGSLCVDVAPAVRANDAEFIVLSGGALLLTLATLLAMAGPSESVLICKFWTPHLLLFQGGNPTRVECLLLCMYQT